MKIEELCHEVNRALCEERGDYTCKPDKNKESQYKDYYYQIYKKLYPDLKSINHIIFDKFRK